MNTDPKLSINKNLDQSIYYGYSFPLSTDIDFFFDEDELSDEQSALRKLRNALSLNNQYQEKLRLLLLQIQAKVEKNNLKLDKITEIIAFKNKRNKIQLKKKQIELYKYEDSKLPPESFRIFERVKHSKGKKTFQNLYKTLIEDSSSENEGEDDDIKPKVKKLEGEYKEDQLLGLQNNSQEIKVKKESVSKSPHKSNRSSKSKKKSVGKKDIKQEENSMEIVPFNKTEFFEDEDEDEDNENDYEDDFDMDVDSEDEIRSIKRRGDRLGLDKFLEEYKGQDPVEIDWLALARKVNSRLILDEKGSLVTALDLYRRFIADEVQEKRAQWTKEEDKALLNAVKIHGTNNWKQVANNIEGKSRVYIRNTNFFR